MSYNEEELMHYGVLGMKWGVRRYQRKDGSLTPAGKRRFKKVANNEELKKETTEYAKLLLKDRSIGSKDDAKELREDANLLKWDGDDKGYKEAMAYAEAYVQNSKLYNQRLRDINNGTLKAGRDFIAVRKGLHGDVDEALVFKKSNEEIQANRYKAKDAKTYAKTGIKVERDSMNRVTSMKAPNASRKQIKKINKMMRSVGRKGDY